MKSTTLGTTAQERTLWCVSVRRTFYSCQVELAMDTLGGKWAVVILGNLTERPRRYGELLRLVPEITEDADPAAARARGRPPDRADGARGCGPHRDLSAARSRTPPGTAGALRLGWDPGGSGRYRDRL